MKNVGRNKRVCFDRRGFLSMLVAGSTVTIAGVATDRFLRGEAQAVSPVT
jgi:hypothetical protein